MEIMDYEKIIKQMIADEAISKEVAAKYFPELKESEGERIVKAIKYALDHVFTNNTTVYETTKEQCFVWLKKLGEQKPAEWSEEDEKFFKTALWHISYSISNGKSTDIHCDTTDWLKSLKDRFTWQPSDEHYDLEEFAKIVRGNLTGISKAVQKLFEAKYLQLTGKKMYGGFKD